MSKFIGAFATFTLLLIGAVNAAEIEWCDDLDEARQAAAQSNRLVLAHFWSSSCPPCVKLEQNVFPADGFAAALQANFVPVKIKVDDNRALARQYDIRRWPTDVILDPSGAVLATQGCPQDAAAYLARLQAVVETHRNGAGAQIAHSNVPPGAAILASDTRSLVGERYTNTSPNVSAPLASNAPAAAARPTAALGEGAINLTLKPNESPSGDRYANSPTAPAEQLAVTLPRQEPAPQVEAVASTNPAPPLPNAAPICLDGYCPVTLTEAEQVAKGDPRYGAVHRGRTYLFAGPGEQRRFLADPDRYAPALSGYDVVLAAERGVFQPGTMDQGVYCNGRIYLFASPETMAHFSKVWEQAVAAKQPNPYELRVRQAEAPTADRGVIRR